MALDPITGILEVGTRLIDRLWPDPAQRDAAKLELLKAQQAGELAELDAHVRLSIAQAEVNKVEAGTDLFRGGWRPAVGWCAAAALFYEYLLRPILPWAVTVAGASVPPLPSIDNAELMTLLFGMLGISVSRSVEKIKGVAR